MKDKEKYTEMVGIRLTKSQKNYLDENDVNLRDTLEYYMDHHMNETKKLRNKEKSLLKSIKESEEQLIKYKTELQEVRVKLGANPEENQSTIELITAKERILNNCRIENNGKINKQILINYINSKKAKRILDAVIIEYNIRDRDNFIKEVYKSLDL